jgi:hypothetical protein
LTQSSGVRSGACPGTSIFCTDNNVSGVTETVSATGLAAATTYLIRVYDFAAGTPATSTFTIAVAPPPATLSTNGTTTLAYGNQNVLTNSTSQTFNLSGANLTGAPGNITVTAPNTSFQVSNNNSTWGATATIAYATATLASTPVYVRFVPQSSGAKSGNITFTGGGVSGAPTVALTGTGVLPAPVATAATNITTAQFDANWNAVTGASSGYLLDVSASSTFGTTAPVTVTEGFSAGTTPPSAWTFTGALSTYTSAGNFGLSSPSLQFNASAQQVVTPTFTGDATQLSFFLKGNSTAAGGSSFLVEGYNGTTWSTIQNITTVPTTAATYTYNSGTTPALPAGVVALRFTYTKTVGNAAFDDVSITYNGVTPSFLTGYNAKPIAGQATVTSTVTGIAQGITYYYRLRSTDGTPSAYSNVITVLPASVGGTAVADQTICSGTQPANLTLSGNVGSVVKWQSASDAAFTTPADIAVALTTLTGAQIGNLTATTYFRAVVQSGTNPTANSSTVIITVNPVSNAGTASSDQTICSASQPANISVTGNTGTVQWQSSTDNVTFANISGATAATLPGATIGSLTQTTYFRAVVTNAPCAPVTSAVVTVNVNQPSAAGTVSSDQVICTGSQPADITVGTFLGTIQWQSSTDNVTFADISGATGNTLTGATIGNLTQTTYFHAVVTNAPCAPATSATVTVTVNGVSVAGNITGAATVCSGTNNTVLTLNGNTGTIQWQSSADNVTFSDLVGETGQTYTAVNLTAQTWFQAVVTNSPCAPATTASVTIDLLTNETPGSVGPNQSICNNSEPAPLTLTGNTGAVVKWQSATDLAFTTPTDIANTTNTLSAIGPISVTTYYRAVIQNGTCGTLNSAAATVSISGTTWDGTVWSNGAPTSTIGATIAANYTSSGDLTACSLTVTNNAVVIITSGDDVNLSGALTVDAGSTFTLQNDANLVQSGNAPNSGSIVVKRNSSALKRLDYTLWSSPVAGQDLLAFSPLTQTTRFYTYNSATNLYNAVTPSGTDFADAQGYLIRMPNNHTTWATVWAGTFNGEPHNGPFAFTMANIDPSHQFNLVGNPYPSPISMTAFTNDNTANITGTLYFWRKTNGVPSMNTYCTWTAGTFVTNNQAEVVDPQGIIQTGQGFFVEATGSSTVVNFSNSMRTGNNAGQFFRSAAEADKSRIWLNATNATGSFSQMAIVYAEGASTTEVDMFDGRHINDGDIALTSMIGDEGYVIQGRALPFDAADVVPLTFTATNAGTYTIAIDHFDGLFAGSQDIFLRDNVNGTTVDLKAGSYTFTSGAGTISGRFDVLYQAPLSVTDPQFANQVVIYANQGGFVINSGAAVMDNVKVYDVRGRLLVEQKAINASETRFTAGEANAVLIVKITSDSHATVTKKVVN